jgi:hypothetical protein
MLKTVYQKIFNSFKRTELSMKLFTLFSIIIFNIPIAIYIYDLYKFDEETVLKYYRTESYNGWQSKYFFPKVDTLNTILIFKTKVILLQICYLLAVKYLSKIMLDSAKSEFEEGKINLARLDYKQHFITSHLTSWFVYCIIIGVSSSLINMFCLEFAASNITFEHVTNDLIFFSSRILCLVACSFFPIMLYNRLRSYKAYTKENLSN